MAIDYGEESWLDAKVGAQDWKDKTPAEKADSAKQGQASAGLSFDMGKKAAQEGRTKPEGGWGNIHFDMGYKEAMEKTKPPTQSEGQKAIAYNEQAAKAMGYDNSQGNFVDNYVKDNKEKFEEKPTSQQAPAGVSFDMGKKAAQEGRTKPEGGFGNIHFDMGYKEAMEKTNKNEPYEIVIENDKSPYNAGKGETPPDKGVSTSATTDINQHRDPNDPKHAPSYRDTKVVYPGQTGENPHESKKPHYAGKPGPGYQGSTDKSGYATGQTTYEERRAQRKKDRQAQEYKFQATAKGAARAEQAKSESPGKDFVKKYAAGPGTSWGSHYQR